jgi:hypothetical protein
VNAPLVAPGYLLLRDAVSTPRSYLTDAALGLTEAAPRALPQDFAIALASTVVDGGVVVKALLVAALWLAGLGAARLAATVVPEAGIPGQLVAATLTIWNPYVAERLLQGHWSLLVGYGALPWIATTMLGWRAGKHISRRNRVGVLPRSQWTAPCRLAFWMALAGLTPTGLMLAATVSLVCSLAPLGAGRPATSDTGAGRPATSDTGAGRPATSDTGAGRPATSEPAGAPRWRYAAAALLIAVLAALPWLVAAAVGTSLNTSQAAGTIAFAARAERGLGTLGSLAGLGGIWNVSAVPASRTTLFGVVGVVVLLAVVAAGLPAVARRRTAVSLLLLGVVSIAVPAAMATAPGLSFVHAVVRSAPGLGVVRDGQKWVALAVPGYAVASAGAVVTLRRWLHPAVAATVCCVALVLVLPDLAWGAWGQVKPVHYPAAWRSVAAAVNGQPAPVAVLPSDSIRQFAWSGRSPVLDPLPRWLRADVLSTGDLSVSGRIIAGEGSHARDVQHLLLAGADSAALSAAGVGWLVVEHATPGETGAAAKTLARLPVVYQDSELTLYRVGGHALGASPTQRWLVIAGHLVWLTMLAVGAVAAIPSLPKLRH